jgi:hypothetical protein
MSTRGTATTIALTGLLLAAAWLVRSYLGGPQAPAPAGSPADPGPAGPALRSAAVDDPSDARPAAERAPAPAAAPRSGAEAPAEALPAVFRGRVVDQDGTPLAGVTAAVRGWVGNDDRLNAHVVEHGAVVWENPAEVVTGADGRFEIAFVPPPPYQFVLDLEAEGMVGAGGRWGRIDPGTVKDFGDVTMRPGAVVRGRLVDGEGRPVPRPSNRLQLSINRYNRKDAPRGELVPESSAWADVAPDGSFEMRKPVAPGTWNLSIRGLLPRERDAEVEVAAPVTAFDVAVWRPEELLRVSGLVLDHAGNPVPRAGFVPVGTPRASSWILSSDREGRFEFEQRPDQADPATPFRLHFTREGYEDATTGELTFGQREVRVVMKRIAAMEVLVVRAADGRPVTEYGLRVMNTDGMRSSTERDVIGGWSHEAGIVQVRTMQSGGRKRIVVEPRRGSGLAMTQMTVEVDVDAPPRLTIELPPAVAQALRLERPDGTAVAGSRVELIDAGGAELTVISNVTAFGGSGWSSNENGLQIDAAETGADGRCEVAGPIDRPLTLRVLGEHPPLVVNGLRIGSDERVLQVAAGAMLRVRVDPPELLAEWRGAAGLPDRGPVPDERRAGLPSVRLQRPLGGYQELFPLDWMLPGVAFDEAGVALLRHVPPGSWTLICEWQDTPEGGRRTMTHPAPVELFEGAAAEVVVDVSAYRTAAVSGTVSVDGEPAAALQLSLRRPALVPGPSGEPRFEQFAVTTDGDGAFRRWLPAGVYQANVTIKLEAGREDHSPFARVRCGPDFTVVAGEPIEVVLTGTVGRARLRFVDPDGRPVADLHLWPAAGGDWFTGPSVAPTDREGVTTVVGTPGVCALACSVRSVKSQANYRERHKALLEEHGGDWEVVQREMDRLVVQLPPVALTPGDGGEPLEIRLPQEWDR